MSFRISDPTRKRPGLRTSPGSSSDLAASPRCLCESPASTIRPLERKAWAPAHSVDRSSHSSPAPRRVPLNSCVSKHAARRTALNGGCITVLCGTVHVPRQNSRTVSLPTLPSYLPHPASFRPRPCYVVLALASGPPRHPPGIP